jgi:hypothetical protein
MQSACGDDVRGSRSGSLRLDGFSPTEGAGTLDVIATSATDGRDVRMRGPFDFCAYGDRADCPYLTRGGLTKKVRFRDPDGYTSKGDETLASDCRVLIDRASGGVQVDLELGIFNGAVVARWQARCDGPVPPERSRSVFRPGGVTDPWTCGPFTTQRSTDEVSLPRFELELRLLHHGRAAACPTNPSRPR